jgi:hypothetical protein
MLPGMWSRGWACRWRNEYLEFLAGRCRPNTVLAVAYDLEVFLSSVGKPLDVITTADALGFMTAQRTGGGAACSWRARTRPGCHRGRCDGGVTVQIAQVLLELGDLVRARMLSGPML